jgi:UDP-N-acetylmuramoyl-tripeptide--D-alanyl-D-alanine ligase
MFTLNDVLEGTGGQRVGGSESAAFRGVVIDSRAVKRGELFAAFRGQKHDGHRFVLQAFAHGAAGALVDRLPPGEDWAAPEWSGPPVVLVEDTGEALQRLANSWRRKHNTQVVGVTGSVGKTTTKELIASLLSRRYSVLRTPANLNTEIGVPITLMQLERSHKIAVLEMAMLDMGEIARLARIAEPNIGVVTNVQPVHLQRLGTIERIAQAKSELVQALPAGGLAVLNADDHRVAEMASLTRADVRTYGLSPRADVWADDIQSHGLRGIEFTVHQGSRKLHAKMGVLGTHTVHSALAAVLVAVHLGMAFEEAVGGLMEVEKGIRLVVGQGIRGSTVLDDTYNANPQSTLAALNLLAEMDGRKVAVLGDMLELGSYEEEGHRLVGRRAGLVADWLLTVGARARWIAEEAQHHGRRALVVESFEARNEAVARLHSGLRPGDFVLVKGSRGMELDEIVSAIRDAA